MAAGKRNLLLSVMLSALLPGSLAYAGCATPAGNAGDVVFAPDGEEHWHGASPNHFMTHLSITDGAPVWGPHVTDAEYCGESAEQPQDVSDGSST